MDILSGAFHFSFKYMVPRHISSKREMQMGWMSPPARREATAKLCLKLRKYMFGQLMEATVRLNAL